MMSPRIKNKILKIIPFGFIWFIFGVVYLILEKGLLGDSQFYPATGNPYDFTRNFVVVTISVTILGLIVGTLETLYINNLFAKNSFGIKLLKKTIIYVLIIFSFLLITTAIGNSIELKTNVIDEKVWKNVNVFLQSFAFWSVEFYLAVIIIVSLFYTEVSDNIGQNVLYNFFIGKYHRPIEEERIFMFLDMKSSTTIAEKLGHINYFEMLKEYFSDLSDPIVEFGGEIYQYVGDEIIVSWDIRTGLKNGNFLKCFFAMKDALNSNSEKFNKNYGLCPTFKAGFHYGKVTAGEIGVLKKEIIFSGDVLNTTARIQGLCNSYHTDLIISGQLIQKLIPEYELSVRSLGKKDLRGRDEAIELFTIE